jgi:hypothetical protein
VNIVTRIERRLFEAGNNSGGTEKVYKAENKATWQQFPMDLAILETIYHNPETSSDSSATNNNAAGEQKNDRQTSLKKTFQKKIES